jgi:hypothetical protein
LVKVEDVVVKEISAIKKKPDTSHWDNRKEALGPYQESVKTSPIAR